ncbi:ribbon-helix-helix domain-containing protein [Halobacteria archaeon HArc-gm2]|nr:ribbon-helix-helix domain-containing protein [Halobacteria archaeon HArc-gm2]
MKYANVSVKFPRELDDELERFLAETGIYTNKSEFIKEAVRSHLQQLNDQTGIAALRLEQMLAQAEQRSESDEELHARLEDLRAEVDADPEAVAAAVEAAREETAERTFEQS